MSSRKIAQMSVEHMLIVAFSLAVLVPSIYFFYAYSQASSTELSAAQFDTMGQEMLSSARTAFSQGSGTWINLDVNIPDNILDINISGNGKEIVFIYQTGVGSSEAVFFSDQVILANGTQDDGSIFSGDPHSGRASFRFTSNQSGAVLIKEHYR